MNTPPRSRPIAGQVAVLLALLGFVGLLARWNPVLSLGCLAVGFASIVAILVVRLFRRA